MGRNKSSRRIKGLQKRGKSWEYRRQVDGKREYYVLETADEAEAIRRVAMLKTENSFQTRDDFQNDVERYLAFKRDTDKHTELTSEWCKGVLAQFAFFVGNKPARNVKDEEILAFYRKLRERMTENGANSYIRAVKSFFGWAEESKLRFDNPSKQLKLRKPASAARTRFATKELRDALIAAAPDDDFKFILYCVFHAGMRFKEVIEAKPEWFNLDAGYVYIHKQVTRYKDREVTYVPKNKKNRYVPLTNTFKAFLQKYGLREPFVLKPEIEHGEWRYRYDFRNPWKNFMKKHDASWITPHVGRHTFASLLAQQNADIYKISEWLGDTLEVTKKHYAHLLPNDNAINLLE